MEYIYAALLLHSAGKEINEKNVTAVIEGAGVSAEKAKIKALVASLEGVNIQELISKPAFAAPAPVAAEEKKAEAAPKEKEEKKEKKVSEEEAAEGLGALFG